MNNTTYIQEMTNDELLTTIRESGELDNHSRKLLDVDLCMDELSRRGKYAKLLTRADIIKAMNDADLSQDGVLGSVVNEDYYVLTGEKLLEVLGFKQ